MSEAQSTRFKVVNFLVCAFSSAFTLMSIIKFIHDYVTFKEKSPEYQNLKNLEEIILNGNNNNWDKSNNLQSQTDYLEL